MSQKILGIIPSRFASTRFPAKPLADIKGKSMIQRVYEQASKAKSLERVIVATDHPKIYDHVKSFGGEVVMTSELHQSGTDRCKEALDKAGENFDFVINIQGDEPFIEPEQIDLLSSCLDTQAELATLVFPGMDGESLFSPNTVKVVVNNHNEALYFSRSPIPYLRNFPKENWAKQHVYNRHIGIYAYRSDILGKITQLKPSSLELLESLEQLRWLENGFKIKVQKTTYESYGIDTPEDLERVLKLVP